MSKKLTNGDKTRNRLSTMTDEELVEIFVRAECEVCPARVLCEVLAADSCRETMLAYFRMEAET